MWINRVGYDASVVVLRGCEVFYVLRRIFI